MQLLYSLIMLDICCSLNDASQVGLVAENIRNPWLGLEGWRGYFDNMMYVGRYVASGDIQIRKLKQHLPGCLEKTGTHLALIGQLFSHWETKNSLSILDFCGSLNMYSRYSLCNGRYVHAHCTYIIHDNVVKADTWILWVCRFSPSCIKSHFLHTFIVVR